MELLVEGKVKLSVSSVLDRNAKEYGKKFLLDGEEDTCWNSDQGLPQWIKAQFEETESSKLLLKVQFQGGFCGKECNITLKKADQPVLSHDFYPEDSNDFQEFPLVLSESESFDNAQVTFKSTTDFYGRIIVYQLSLEKLD